MLFFSSDLHLGDKAIIRWRGFPSVSAHDQAILAAINRRVGLDDELWLLGDLCHPNRASVRALREGIRCEHVHVIVGNHDKQSLFQNLMREERLFESVDYYAEVGKVRREGYKLCLSHYPMLDWNRAIHGAYMLHGHIHSQPADDEPTAPNGEPVATAAMAGRPHDNTRDGMGMRGYNAWCREQGIRRFDVGVDANGYAPVSVEEIRAYLPDDASWRRMHHLPDDWE